MIKIFLKTVFIVFFVNILHPFVVESSSSVEVRAAAFFHQSKRFREIYGNVGGSYQIEASTSVYGCFEEWANFDWFTKHGKSHRFNDPTRISIANISCGIKYPYQFCEQLTVYAGIGPSLSNIWLKNKLSCHRHESISKLAIGGVVKTGMYYFINQCVFIDIFVDYLYQPIHFKKEVDVGGFKTGAGIGMMF